MPDHGRMVALLITGDRNAEDGTKAPDWYDALVAAVTSYERAGDEARVLIHGSCRRRETGEPCGIDHLAEMVGAARVWDVVAMPAQWSAHGNRAGPIRNRDMVAVLERLECCGYEVACLACHDSLPGSKGTKDCARRAIAVSIATWLLTSDGAMRALTKDDIA
jgi:hypothetical protein